MLVQKQNLLLKLIIFYQVLKESEEEQSVLKTIHIYEGWSIECCRSCSMAFWKWSNPL